MDKPLIKFLLTSRIILCLTVLTALPGVLVFSTAALGAPLDYVPFSTLKVEGFLSWLDGRVGFEQQPGGTGTLNDFRKDLGLPADHKTFRLILSVRPLEHHLLRLYGSVPEIYKGERNLDRTLQTRNTIYPAGSDIETEMTYGSFGLGYDLNFLEGPRWYAGLNGDLRYINARFRIMGTGVNSGREDTLSITELVPCVGGHASVKTMMPFPGRAMMPICGGFARMDFGLMPDYLNYTDIRLGLSTELPTPFGPLFELKVGYEHESIFHDRESVSGKILEFKRDGVFVSLGAAF